MYPLSDSFYATSTRHLRDINETFRIECYFQRNGYATHEIISPACAYTEPGEYKVVVKVIDILGNDTTKTLKVQVK